MKFLLPALFICCSLSCSTPSGETGAGNPLSGTFTIHTDESFLPLVQVLVDAYAVHYPAVTIRIDTLFVANPYSCLASRDIRSVLTGHPWNPRDSAALSQRGIQAHVFHFATDAVVVVAAGPTTQAQEEHVYDTCPGPAGPGPFTSAVTDRSGSENSRFLESRYHATPGCLGSWLAASTQTGVLKYVAGHPGSVGFVGFSHLCEQEQLAVKQWKTIIHFVPYLAPDSTPVYPSQSTLADGSYPFRRPLYLATGEPFAGPATGFGAFVASADGQRIIRLFGLAPARTPPREIIINP